MKKVLRSCPAPLASTAVPLRLRLPLPALEALMVVAWSSGFVGIRFSTNYAPVLLVVFWRFAAITVCLLPFVAREIAGASRAALMRQALIGLFGLAGYIAGVAKGIELGVSTGLTALIANLLPVGTVVLSRVVFGERSGWRTWAGMALGLAGVAIVCRDALTPGSAPSWAYALPVAGMMSLAVATVSQQRSASRRDSLGLAATLWIHCAVSLLAFGCLQGAKGSLLPVPSAGFVFGVAWTAVLSTLGGYGLYWLCLRRSSPARVSSVLFLSPSVTLVWAWAMFGEALSWPMLAGTIVSGAGIVMMARQTASAQG
ncbi:multidrug DMT transporter permease [Caballeronia fortuita]|uniref:Multidrug DMT transporter permease n=1 Tax=Caballeronia fortuita TaxID=1777138 RepID=A0A158DZX8_9BURK|nr:DMT family transporter [Caballeronia fortuita]SAK99247.1 multidrug DMT transporter permease [Caballeronia fortuita]